MNSFLTKFDTKTLMLNHWIAEKIADLKQFRLQPLQNWSDMKENLKKNRSSIWTEKIFPVWNGQSGKKNVMCGFETISNIGASKFLPYVRKQMKCFYMKKKFYSF